MKQKNQHNGWSLEDKRCPVCKKLKNNKKKDREFDTYQAFRAHYEAKHRVLSYDDESSRFPLNAPFPEEDLQKKYVRKQKNGTIIRGMRLYKLGGNNHQILWMDDDGNEYDMCPVDGCGKVIKRKASGIPERDAMIRHIKNNHSIEKERERMRKIIALDIIKVWNSIRRKPTKADWIFNTQLEKTEILRNVKDEDTKETLEEAIKYVGGYDFVIDHEINIHHAYRRLLKKDPQFYNESLPDDPILGRVEKERIKNNENHPNFKNRFGMKELEFKQKSRPDEYKLVKKQKKSSEKVLLAAISNARRDKEIPEKVSEGADSIDEDNEEEDEHKKYEGDEKRIRPLKIWPKDVAVAERLIVKRNLKEIAREYMFLRAGDTRTEQFGDRVVLASNERDKDGIQHRYVVEKITPFAIKDDEIVIVIEEMFCPKCGDKMDLNIFKKSFRCKQCTIEDNKPFHLELLGVPLYLYRREIKGKLHSVAYIKTDIKQQIKKQYKLMYLKYPKEQYVVEILKEGLPDISTFIKGRRESLKRRIDWKEGMEIRRKNPENYLPIRYSQFMMMEPETEGRDNHQILWMDDDGNEYDMCPVDGCGKVIKRKASGIPERDAMIRHIKNNHSIEKIWATYVSKKSKKGQVKSLVFFLEMSTSVKNRRL